MMKLHKILLLAAMCCMPLQHAFSAPIENVCVLVNDVTGQTSLPLQAKMIGSMEVVTRQLFLDKDAEKIAGAEADYARLLTEIGDRVFAGYEVEQVMVVPDAELTYVRMDVHPWGEVIKQPEVDIQFSGIAPETASLLAEYVDGMRPHLVGIIEGAPTEAADWASSLLRGNVQHWVGITLPDFKAAVDTVSENGKTVVQVIIYPVGQIVTNTKYEMRSESIPNLLLMKLKYKYLNEANKLRGLPVDHIKRHKAELEKALTDKLLAEEEIKNYNLVPAVELVPGTELGVNIMLNSKKYKIWFEGYGDIGREENNLSGKAHVGKFISPQDEIFGEAEVVLDDVDWNFGAGYTRYWGKSAWSYTRRMPIGENDYRLEYRLSPKWGLRAEHYSTQDRNEFGVRYRIHEFLSAEYVYGGDEFYLRVIGNL